MRRRQLIFIWKCCFFIAFSNIIALTLYAQENKSAATVYFIRTIGNKSAWGALNVFVDAEFQCKINDHKYFSRSLAPGLHLFSLQAEGKKYKKKIEQIPLQLEAGKTYYMQVAVMYGTLFNYLYLKEVTENTANLVLPKLSEDRSCAK